MRTKPCERSKYTVYLERAKQCKEAAESKKGQRYAGQSHEEALAFFSSVASEDEEVKRFFKHMSHLISIKSNAEYGDTNMKEKDATSALQHMKRCFESIMGKFPKY